MQHQHQLVGAAMQMTLRHYGWSAGWNSWLCPGMLFLVVRSLQAKGTI